jgi:hypothetical protein
MDTRDCQSCSFCEPDELCVAHDAEKDVLPAEAGGRIIVDFNNEDVEID